MKFNKKQQKVLTNLFREEINRLTHLLDGNACGLNIINDYYKRLLKERAILKKLQKKLNLKRTVKKKIIYEGLND